MTRPTFVTDHPGCVAGPPGAVFRAADANMIRRRAPPPDRRTAVAAARATAPGNPAPPPAAAAPVRPPAGAIAVASPRTANPLGAPAPEAPSIRRLRRDTPKVRRSHVTEAERPAEAIAAMPSASHAGRPRAARAAPAATRDATTFPAAATGADRPAKPRRNASPDCSPAVPGTVK